MEEVSIQELYDQGFGFVVKGSVKNYVKNRDNKLHFYQQEMLEAYLEGKNILDGSCHVVTTHAMFMALPVEVLRQYEVIVDEDILFSIFKNTSCISFDELRMLCESAHISAYHKKRLYEILQLPNVPVTIVSATINQTLCERYFKGRRIHFMDIPLIRYQGKLKQYTAYSISRSFIDSVGWECLKNSIEKLLDGDMGNIVTFKMIDATKEIYFGKSEGFNGYQSGRLLSHFLYDFSTTTSFR